MKLSYKARTGQQILGWQRRREGAELLLTGPGFQPAGFSLGTYAPAALQRALDALICAPFQPARDWMSHPVEYKDVYTFTPPARFAACQDHETYLSVHAPAWTDHGDGHRLPGSTGGFNPPRTAVLYMIGTPYFHRVLGHFHFEHALAFLREGIATGTPRRVQRRRSAGWRMPPLTVYVGRPTRWGNPWTVAGYRAIGWQGTDDEIRQVCVDAYRAWLLGERHWAHGERLAPPPDPAELRGYNLACWCPEGSPCHADVLLSLANPGLDTIRIPSRSHAPLEQEPRP
jgi:hypothetical protein